MSTLLLLKVKIEKMKSRTRQMHLFSSDITGPERLIPWEPNPAAVGAEVFIDRQRQSVLRAWERLGILHSDQLPCKIFLNISQFYSLLRFAGRCCFPSNAFL